MKTWKYISHVVLKDSYKGKFNNKQYSSIREFTESREFNEIRHSITDHPPQVSAVAGVIWDQSRRYCLVDECDLIIPLWKIKEAIPSPKPHHIRYYMNGGTGYFRLWYRSPKTKQERTWNTTHDEDIEEYRVKLRAKRTGHNLPTSWDDKPRSDIKTRKNWKSKRKTQYMS